MHRGMIQLPVWVTILVLKGQGENQVINMKLNVRLNGGSWVKGWSVNYISVKYWVQCGLSLIFNDGLLGGGREKVLLSLFPHFGLV